MRVFITDLASYNQSYLIGRWVELGIEKEELQQTISEILKEGEEACDDGSIHEEYFLTDWEDNEFNLEVGEYSDIFKLNEEVARIKELDLEDYQKKCVSFLLDNSIVSNLDEALERYEDVLIYEEGPFIILCQSGKITNTQGMTYEDRSRCRAICS